jgi:hypothetical protein
VAAPKKPFKNFKPLQKKKIPIQSNQIYSRNDAGAA